MTDPRPSIDLGELADLQAGLLTAEEEHDLRVRIAADPQALALLGALENTRGELADLTEEQEEVPDDVAARLDAALAAEPPLSASSVETSPSAPRAMAPAAEPTVSTDDDMGGQVVDLSNARRRRRWLGPTLVAAAAVVVAVVIGIVLRPQAQGPIPADTPAIGAADLTSLWPGIRGSDDPGFLASGFDLTTCLDTVSGLSGAQVIGTKQVRFDGQPAVVVAVDEPSSGTEQQVRLLAFSPQCRAGTPDGVLGQTSVPR
jgi:hypothetical protein